MRHSHGSVDILLRESGGLLEDGSALQTFLAIADPSGDSSEYGGSPAVASRDEVKMLIPLLSAAHESGELGVETRRVLEERRMTDALIDRELGARRRFSWTDRLCKAAIGFVRVFRCLCLWPEIPFPGKRIRHSPILKVHTDVGPQND